VVSFTDVRDIFVLRICIVANTQIRFNSKCWSGTPIIENCFFRVLQSELVIVTQRKNERLFGVVCCVCTILRTAPFQGSEASDFLVEICPDDCECVSHPVALLVELHGTKPMIAGSVQQRHLFDGLGKELLHGGFLFS
jgi:hypothetical protein